MVKPVDKLNAREFKKIRNHWLDEFGIVAKAGPAWLLDKRNKLFMARRELFEMELDKIRVDTLGLYIGEWRNEMFRFSIEGTQLFGPLAEKKVLTVSDGKKFLRGEQQQIKTDETGYVLVQSKQDWLGCGYVKDGLLTPFISKNRRLILDSPD